MVTPPPYWGMFPPIDISFSESCACDYYMCSYLVFSNDLSVVGKFVASSSCLDSWEGWYGMELVIAVHFYGDHLLVLSGIQPIVWLTSLAIIVG